MHQVQSGATRDRRIPTERGRWPNGARRHDLALFVTMQTPGASTCTAQKDLVGIFSRKSRSTYGSLAITLLAQTEPRMYASRSRRRVHRGATNALGNAERRYGELRRDSTITAASITNAAVNKAARTP